MTVQFPSIILPTVIALGTEVEVVNDVAEHTSLEMTTSHLQDMEIHIVATEIVVVGVPGNLWCWVELSPSLSTTSAAYWAAIGGGGGTQTPLAPYVEVATGVTLTVHTIILPWSIHSPYARLVVQTPVAAFAATAMWWVQATVSAKGG